MMAQGKQLTLSQEQLEGCIQTLRSTVTACPVRTSGSSPPGSWSSSAGKKRRSAVKDSFLQG